MDFERGPEFLSPKPENSDAGYSEAEAAKSIEGVKSDVKQLGNKRKPLPSTSSRKEKIIVSYRINLEKIFALVEKISILNGKNYRQEEQIIEEIKNLRRVQEELLNALLLEQKDALTQESISKEAWNLIQ